MPTIPAGLEPFMLAASYGHTVLLAVAIWGASGRAGLASAQRAAAGVLNRGDLTMTRKKLNRPFATGGQIAAARVVLGLSQVEVAKFAGCRQGTVSYVENSPTMRRTKPRMQIIRVLAAKGLDPRNIDFDAPPEFEETSRRPPSRQTPPAPRVAAPLRAAPLRVAAPRSRVTPPALKAAASVSRAALLARLAAPPAKQAPPPKEAPPVSPRLISPPAQLPGELSPFAFGTLDDAFNRWVFVQGERGDAMRALIDDMRYRRVPFNADLLR